MPNIDLRTQWSGTEKFVSFMKALQKALGFIEIITLLVRNSCTAEESHLEDVNDA